MCLPEAGGRVIAAPGEGHQQIVHFPRRPAPPRSTHGARAAAAASPSAARSRGSLPGPRRRRGDQPDLHRIRGYGGKAAPHILPVRRVEVAPGVPDQPGAGRPAAPAQHLARPEPRPMSPGDGSITKPIWQKGAFWPTPTHCRSSGAGAESVSRRQRADIHRSTTYFVGTRVPIQIAYRCGQRARRVATPASIRGCRGPARRWPPSPSPPLPAAAGRQTGTPPPHTSSRAARDDVAERDQAIKPRRQRPLAPLAASMVRGCSVPLATPVPASSLHHSCR